MIEEEIFEALKKQAEILFNYKTQLIEAGFTNEQAMKIIIAYQTALINANQMALIEQEKNKLLATTIESNLFKM